MFVTCLIQMITNMLLILIVDIATVLVRQNDCYSTVFMADRWALQLLLHDICRFVWTLSGIHACTWYPYTQLASKGLLSIHAFSSTLSPAGRKAVGQNAGMTLMGVSHVGLPFALSQSPYTFVTEYTISDFIGHWFWVVSTGNPQ